MNEQARSRSRGRGRVLRRGLRVRNGSARGFRSSGRHVVERLVHGPRRRRRLEQRRIGRRVVEQRIERSWRRRPERDRRPGRLLEDGEGGRPACVRRVHEAEVLLAAPSLRGERIVQGGARLHRGVCGRRLRLRPHVLGRRRQRRSAPPRRRHVRVATMRERVPERVRLRRRVPVLVAAILHTLRERFDGLE